MFRHALDHDRKVGHHPARAPSAASNGAMIAPAAAMVTGISMNVCPFSSRMMSRRTLPS